MPACTSPLQAQQQLQELGPCETASVAWSLARLCFRPRLSWMAAFLRRTAVLLPRYSAAELAMLLDAVSRYGGIFVPFHTHHLGDTYTVLD